jgi:hypothetical protein
MSTIETRRASPGRMRPAGTGKSDREVASKIRCKWGAGSPDERSNEYAPELR